MKRLLLFALFGLYSLFQSAFASGGYINISVPNNPHQNSLSFGVEIYKDNTFIIKREISTGTQQYPTGDPPSYYPLNINLIYDANPNFEYNIQLTADPQSCAAILTATCQSPYSRTSKCVNMVWNNANQSPVPYFLSFVFIYNNTSNNTANYTVYCSAQ